MRPAVALALVPLVAGSVALAFGACGGAAFSAGADDGGALVDAPADSHATGSFCALEAGTHTLCDDFDGPTLTNIWPTYQRDSNAIAQDDPAIFVSAPSSFESACPANSSGLIHARIGKQFAIASHVIVAFDLHLDKVGIKPSGVGGTTFVLIALGANYSLGMSANQDEINFYEDITSADGGTKDTDQNVAPTARILGNWVRVTLDVDLAAGKVAANANGTIFGPTPITPPTGIAPTVYLGLTSRNVTLPVQAHYDNVTIDVTTP